MFGLNFILEAKDVLIDYIKAGRIRRSDVDDFASSVVRLRRSVERMTEDPEIRAKLEERITSAPRGEEALGSYKPPVSTLTREEVSSAVVDMQLAISEDQWASAMATATMLLKDMLV